MLPTSKREDLATELALKAQKSIRSKQQNFKRPQTKSPMLKFSKMTRSGIDSQLRASYSPNVSSGLRNNPTSRCLDSNIQSPLVTFTPSSTKNTNQKEKGEKKDITDELLDF